MRAMLVTLTLALLPFAANAQTSAETQSPIADVVVTANRVPTDIESIAAGVSVIDRQTIDMRDYTNVAEALAAVPGLRVAQSGGPGGNASVFIRGADSNEVLVLRDGMPLNDASDPSNAFNFGVDTLADVQRIEVIRGPMAALYGSGAVGGVINFITKRGTGDGPHVSGEIAGGYPKQVAGDVSLTGVSGPWDYAAIVESQSTEGFDTTPPRESIYTGVPDGYRAQVATLNLGYTPVAGTRLSLLLRASTSTFGFNTLGSPTYDDANSTGTADEVLGRIGGATTLLHGALDTSAYVGRLQDDRQYTEPLAAADPNQASSDSRYHAYRTDVQVNNVLHLDRLVTIPGATDALLTFGYEHIADQAKVRINTNGLFGPYTQQADAHLDSDAGYAGLQGTVLRDLVLTAQLRQDAVEGRNPFTWRTGAVLALPALDTHLKAAYGTAFLTASLFDRYGVDSDGYHGNPDLRPETAQEFEFGFATDLPGLGQSNLVSFGTTYWHTQVRDLIETVFSPAYTDVNIGSAHLQGFETVLTLRPTPWMSIDAQWSYTLAEDADTTTQLLRRPINAGSLDARISPVPALIIAPELVFTGAFSDFLIDDSGNSAAVGTSRQGVLCNLTATYQLVPRVQLFAAGRNLFDSKFEPVSGYVTPGASFLAGTRVAF